MKQVALRYFAISIVFLSTAIVFYSQGGVSLGRFLLFITSGMACGVNLAQGVISWRLAK